MSLASRRRQRHGLGKRLSRFPALPLNTSTELDEPWEIGLAGDVGETTGTDVQRARTVESGCVGDVNRFRPELQRNPLLDFDALENRDVPIVLSGRPSPEGARDVPECAAWRYGERGYVQVRIQLVFRPARHVRVRTAGIGTLCRVPGCCVEWIERL